MAPHPHHVRPASPSDAEPLVAMMRLFHAAEHGRVAREELHAALARLLDDPRLGRAIVAVHGAEALGYALVTFGFDVARGAPAGALSELYVRPAARRRGVGRSLVRAAESAAVAAGAGDLHLTLLPENEPAFALLRDCGYETPPRVVLSKRLAAAKADALR